jgi:decaprenylphospho-beta-D-erythro-pentofuranosid-2-ulose 2-reductase
MRIVVIGGTSAIAQECCNVWLSKGLQELVLTGRDPKGLSRIARDLRVRHPQTAVITEAFDHLDPKSIKEFVVEVSKKRVDLILIAHGSLTSQVRAAGEVDYLWHEFQVNASSPITFAELFSNVLEQQRFGHLAIIGSVAGDRGRAVNHAYGAAKAALATYVSGLQHRFARTKVKVSLIKPGPTRTAMTLNAHVGPSKLADPERVARRITEGLAKGRRVIYSPRIWRLIMLVVRALPFSLFKYLRF